MFKSRSLSVIAVALVVIMLASCGGSAPAATTTAATTAAATTAAATTTTTTAAPTEPEKELYKIEQFNTYANYMGDQSGWFGQMLKEKFNIEINIIAPNVAGTGDTLYQTRTAAGNLGDSLVISKGRVIDCQVAGLVLNLSPYLDKYPNIQKLSTAYDAFAKMFPDGNVYGIPGRVSVQAPTVPAGRGLNPEVAPYIRYDWYLDIGAPEIDGWDGLLDVLDQMVKANPVSVTGAKTYALSAFPDWDGNSVRAAHEMLYMNGFNAGSGYIWMNATDKTTEIVTDPNGIYYQNLKWLNKAYNMGIFDPDSATQNWDNIATKAGVDQSLAFAWWPFLASSVFARIDLSVRPPFAPVPVKGMVLNSPSYNMFGMEGNAYAIGSGAKYPERIMELYDWLCSPEGILVINGHVEGVTYEMKDGKPYLTDFGLNADQDKQAPAEMGGGTWNDGAPKFNYPLTHQDDPNELLNGAAPNSSLWESTISLNANEFNAKWAETYGSDNPMKYFLDNGYMIVTPATDYTSPSEPSDIQTIRAQIKEIVQPAGWQMIYATSDAEFQKIWDEALAKLPDFGLEQLLEWDMQIVDDRFASIERVMSGN